MITHFHVKNFKCLRDVAVDLEPFTILIGPNDSGKSSLLDAMQMLGKVALETSQEESHRLWPDMVWRRDLSRAFSWSISLSASGDMSEYSLETSILGEIIGESIQHKGVAICHVETQHNPVPQIPGGRHASRYLRNPTTSERTPLHPLQTALSTFVRSNESRTATIITALSELATTAKYCLDPDAMRPPSPLQPNPVLSRCGDNLATVLEAITSGPDGSARASLEGVLHKAIPTIRGITLPTVKDNKKSLCYVLSGNGRAPVAIPAMQASDGALLLTAFLALVFGDTPDILLIEEPENGLHPSRLKLVIDTLRKISNGEIGNRPRQVIVTTHSPILLNYAKPEEVRIFQRDEEGTTRVTPMSKVKGIENLIKEFAVGELWYLLGEDALLKEQPA